MRNTAVRLKRATSRLFVHRPVQGRFKGERRPMLAGAVLILGSLTLGCQNPMSFNFLGTAHYDGKKFRDLEGQFEAIALSPSGERVAFRGRDSSDRYVLFVADIDGLTRRIASTGASDGPVIWSGDESTLYYLDMVPRPDGMFDGATIQQYTFATGAIRQALYAVPLIPFVPSPDGTRLLVAGHTNLEHLILPEWRNRILDPTNGTAVSVALDYLPVPDSRAAVWAPDGRHVALMAPSKEAPDGPLSIVILAAPDWRPVQASDSTFSRRYSALAWEDSNVLRVVDIVPGDFVTINRLGSDGRRLDESKIELDSPPQDQRYRYGTPILSRGAHRVLVSRQASDYLTGSPVGFKQHVYVENGQRRLIETSEALEPIGWCRDDRVLFLSGYYQHRRPVVREIGAVKP